jgi:hypothetical protein
VAASSSSSLNTTPRIAVEPLKILARQRQRVLTNGGGIDLKELTDMEKSIAPGLITRLDPVKEQPTRSIGAKGMTKRVLLRVSILVQREIEDGAADDRDEELTCGNSAMKPRLR